MAVPASYSVAGVSPFSIVDDIRGTHGETDDPDVGPGGSGRRGPWFCEVPADSDCSRAERWLPATSRGGHYGCGQTRDVAGDCGRDRYGRGGAGCDGECGPSGHCRPHCFRVRQGSQSGRRAGGARHAAGAGATGRHGSPARPSQINFGRMQQLVKQGVLAQTEYDNATAQQKATAAQVGEIRATIARKTIRAPFSGILGLRQVNLGQYLSAGEAIVSLQSLNPIYVNFGVPQQTAVQVRVGRTLRVSSNDVGGIKFSGRVTALDSVVNEGTRNVQVQATLANPGGKLRPGMFVQVEITTGTERPVIALPASAINDAPYGDSVYVVSDLKDPKGNTYRGVRQQSVKLEGSRGDQVAVVSGINPGDEVVSSGVFKLRNGAAVQVNNKVQPGNSPAPRPEDS